MAKKKFALKKVLAGFVSAAVLASSLFAGSVFAVDGGTITPPTQIVDVGGKTEVVDDHVTATKTVAKTNEENKFEITLQVTTQEELKNVSVSPDALVVLVIDKSGSMAWDADGNDHVDTEDTRMYAAKTAANDFLDKFASTEGKRYAAVVKYSQNAETISFKKPWFDVNNENERTNLKSSINKIQPSGSTNIEGGLQLAYNLIKSARMDDNLKSITNASIILLTDGFPTAHIPKKLANRDSIVFISGISSSDYLKDDEVGYAEWSPAEAVGNKITADPENVSLYSIAFATGDAKFQNENGRFTKKSVYSWLNGFSVAFEAKNKDSLMTQFKNINKLIALGAAAWQVTDPMGDYITYVGKVNTGDGNQVDTGTNNDTLTWYLRNSTAETEKDGSVTTFTYTLKYYVMLDNTADGFEFNKGYNTNKPTTLKYYLFSKKDQTPPAVEDMPTLSFQIPSVKGFCGTLSFKKTDTDGNGLAGAKFMLTIKDSGYTWEKEATSADDGTVTFSNIPSGHTYTLSETSAPDGYVTSGETWEVKVAYGTTTVTDQDSPYTFVNTPDSPETYGVVYRFTGEVQPPDGSVTLPEDSKLYAVGASVTTAKTPKVDDTENWWYFDGWYTDEECTEANRVYPGNTIAMIEGGLVLYGKWEKESKTPVEDTATYAYYDYGSENVTIRFVALQGENDVEANIAYPGTAEDPRWAYDETVGKDAPLSPVVFFVKADEGYQDPTNVWIYSSNATQTTPEQVGNLYSIDSVVDALRAKNVSESLLTIAEQYAETYKAEGYTHAFFFTVKRSDDGSVEYLNRFFKVTTNRIYDGSELNVTGVTKTITGGTGTVEEPFDFVILGTPRLVELNELEEETTAPEGVLFATGSVTMDEWGTEGTRSITFYPEDGFNPYDEDTWANGYGLYDFIVKELPGNDANWEYDGTVYPLKATWNGEELVFEGSANFENKYTEPDEPPVDPPVEPDYYRLTINKTWVGGEYDGNVTFDITRVYNSGRTGSTKTVTLKDGKDSIKTSLTAGTYVITENVPEGWEASYPDGTTIVIENKDVEIDVVNTKIEEEIPEESTPLAPPTDQDPSQAEGPSAPSEEIIDEDIPLVNPPKTGTAAGSALAVLVAAAALGAVVLRKRK